LLVRTSLVALVAAGCAAPDGIAVGVVVDTTQTGEDVHVSWSRGPDLPVPTPDRTSATTSLGEGLIVVPTTEVRLQPWSGSPVSVAMDLVDPYFQLYPGGADEAAVLAESVGGETRLWEIRGRSAQRLPFDLDGEPFVGGAVVNGELWFRRDGRLARVDLTTGTFLHTGLPADDVALFVAGGFGRVAVGGDRWLMVVDVATGETWSAEVAEVGSGFMAFEDPDTLLMGVSGDEGKGLRVLRLEDGFITPVADVPRPFVWGFHGTLARDQAAALDWSPGEVDVDGAPDMTAWDTAVVRISVVAP